MPNHDSVNAMIEALRDVHDAVAIVGVSHQGLFLPLIAAARPVRRLVFVNALIPRPGRPFIEILKEEAVFAPGLLEATNQERRWHDE
jgi:esterase/lipase